MLEENKILLEKEILTKEEMLKVVDDKKITSGEIRDLVKKIIEKVF